jgi:polyisoprenoid-binding protein YceI
MRSLWLTIVALAISGCCLAASTPVDVERSTLSIRVFKKGLLSGLSDQVLDAARLPEIAFVSRSVRPAGENLYTVDGDLTLHGVTHRLTLAVSLRNGHYTGSVKLKQTEFGITPISLVGGSVKVKDEIEISFDIVLPAK